MQLTLPSRVEPIGTLVLERGAQAGRCYRFETSVCKNPVCQCEHVTLYFLADSPQLEPAKEAGRPVLASLELDLAKRRIHDLKTLEANTTAAALGKAVVGEMLERDWDGLQRLYVGLKHYYTEHADLDAIEAEFPEDATDGLTVGYYEILPYALPVEFTCDNREWVMDDQYCVMPKCSCHYAVMAFWPLHCAGDQKTAPREPVATVRYDYRSGSLENLSDTKKQGAGVSTIFETFKRAKPDLNSFLARRHAALRHLFRCAINRKRPPVQTPKPARNAPCPCGSGKKYKRCCGAPSGKT